MNKKDAIKVFETKVGGGEITVRLALTSDPSPYSPLDVDNTVKLVFGGKKAHLSTPTWEGYRSRDSLVESVTNEEGKKAAEAFDSQVWQLPIYMYEHSGITISTSPFGCSFDSWCAGVAFVFKENEPDEEKAKELIQQWVALYDQYLTGDVYGAELEVVSRCRCCGQEVIELEESCWNYYGQDWINNGVWDWVQDALPLKYCTDDDTVGYNILPLIKTFLGGKPDETK